MVIMALLASAAFAQTAPLKSPGSRIIGGFKYEEFELNLPEVGVEVDRVELKNGMILYLYEDHRLPIVNVYGLIRCGSIFDSPERDGLSGLVGTVMRTGGSKTISGDSLSILLEFIGGSLETWIRSEEGGAQLNVLSQDLDMGLKLFADLLRNPAFPQEKLDLAKVDLKNSIKRRNDQPGSITERFFNHTIYGDHPFGRILEWASVKTITPEGLHEYHRRFFAPNNMMVAISGDFKKADLIKKFEKYFGDWKKSDYPVPPYPPVAFSFKPGVYLVKKDINQANIRIGQLGVRRGNPDKHAIDLLNYILGGGSFTSRLTSRVRSDEGLAYSTGSSFSTNSRDYGTFYAYCQTKSSTAYKATRIISEEIEKIRNEGVTEQELKEARDAVINRFVFTFDNPAKIVQSLMNLEFDGYPADYYKTYLDNYRQVTLAQVKAVAQKYLQPDSLTYLIVGKPETFDKPLDEFGTVTTIELTDPVLE